MNAENESALVEKAQSGCRTALERLLECRYPKMLGLARGILRNDDDARDASQEAALRIVNKLDQLDDAAAFGQWSNTIIRRCCLRILQQRNWAASSTVDFDDELLEASDRADSGQRIEDRIQIGELFQLVGERAAEILRLRLQLGLSVAETAASLGVSEGAIKVRLHRARQKALQFA